MGKDTRIKKGEIRNPNGRPKGSLSVVGELKRQLAKVVDKETKKTKLQEMVEAILEKGVKDKDVAMLKDIINRVDGMPKQSIDHTTDGKELPTPILTLDSYGIQGDHSDTENNSAEEED